MTETMNDAATDPQQTIAELQRKLAERTAERDELLQQQTATADVLKIISRSTVELETVLDTLVETAARLYRADQTGMFRRRGDMYHLVASRGLSEEAKEFFRTHPFAPDRSNVTGRVASERRTIHVPDVLQDPEYAFSEAQRIMGYRTMLGVPLLREDALLGIFAIGRTRVEPFTPKEIELVTTFADQAVIAIENARLFNELRESLERQTATGEILKSITGSVTDARPVFEVIVRNLQRLFGTRLATVMVLKDGNIHLGAASDDPEFEVLNRGYPRPLDASSGGGRAMLSKQVLQFAPIQGNLAVPPATQQFARELGFNAAIFAPIIRDDKVTGVIATARRGDAPFDEKQIALIKSFADQAAIAIENVRLFEEVQAKTRELSQSLDDLRAAQDRLVQTEKLASLGQLTAGIAHEIKNPLNFVNNFSALSIELVARVIRTEGTVSSA